MRTNEWGGCLGERGAREEDEEDKECFERVAADEEIALREVDSSAAEEGVVRTDRRLLALLNMVPLNAVPPDELRKARSYAGGPTGHGR